LVLQASRYQTLEGVLVSRKALPSGDLLLRFVTERGPLLARAKSGARPGGRSGRLGLYHRLSFQVYQRPGAEVATLTQVELLERLSAEAPTRFFAQGFLAELGVGTLSPEVAERGYPVFVSGMRGIKEAKDPRVPLVWAGFRLLALAGYAPGGGGVYLGPRGLSPEFSEGAVYLGEEGARALASVLTRPGKEATAHLFDAPLDRLLEGLIRYAEHHLGPLRSARGVRALM